MEDVRSGSIYKNLVDNEKINISLIVNYDDASIHKSATLNMCPILFGIAELPIEKSFKRSNIFMAGVWFGPQKPDVDVFWKKCFFDEFEIVRNGLSVEMNGHIYRINVNLLYINMDQLAKAKSLNHILFSGFYGCTKCEHPAESVIVAERNDKKIYKRIYPYFKYENPGKKVEYEKYAQIAEETGADFKGLKGKTILSKYLSLPDQVPVDVLHCVYEGVAKKILSLPPFSTKSVIRESSNIYNNIKMPFFFHRRPRNLNNIAKWKGSEFKWFVLYFAPIFQGVIDRENLALVLVLSTFMRIGTDPNIKESDIEKADLLSETFCQMFESIHGKENCTMNIHLFSHLTEQIKLYGALTNTSVFIFEDFLGYLKSLCHGTHSFSEQVVKNYLYEKATLQFQESIIRTDTIHSVLMKTVQSFKDEYEDRIRSKITTQGHKNNRVIVHTLKKDYPSYIEKNSFKTCTKITINNQLYYSKKDQMKTRSSFVCFKDDDGDKFFGEIITFIVKENEGPDSNQILAVVDEFKYSKKRFFEGEEKALEEININFKKIFDQLLFDRYFFMIKKMGSITIINTTNITCHAISFKDCSGNLIATCCDTLFEYS